MLVTDACGWSAEPCECSALDQLRLDQPELAEAAEAMAVRHLYRWTGSRFGPCPVTIRPCRSDCRTQGQIIDNGGSGLPVLWWMGASCGCGDTGDGCSCARVCQINLTGPVVSVDEVWIDGVLLPPSSYRVDNARYLVRTDGECWPECNDLAAPHTEAGTWAVTYRSGLPVPPGGEAVAGVLACEIAKAVCKDSSCALPTRVRSLSREGVTIAMLDDFTGLESGMTGIWLVDSWISVNRPHSRHASVWSPETENRRPRVTTWP